MTRDDVQRWLDRYVEAWRTYDRESVRALFSPDAEQRDHPWEEPVRGPDAIADDWLADKDEPGTYEASYEPFAIDGNRAVAVGTSSYDDASGKRVYHNAFVLEFDERGACRSFRDFYMLER